MGYFDDVVDAAAAERDRRQVEEAERERASRAMMAELLANFIDVATRKGCPLHSVEGVPGHTEAWAVPYTSGDGYANGELLVFRDATVRHGREVTVRRRFREAKTMRKPYSYAEFEAWRDPKRVKDALTSYLRFY